MCEFCGNKQGTQWQFNELIVTKTNWFLLQFLRLHRLCINHVLGAYCSTQTCNTFVFLLSRSHHKILYCLRGDQPFQKELHLRSIRSVSTTRLFYQIWHCSEDHKSCIQALRGHFHCERCCDKGTVGYKRFVQHLCNAFQIWTSRSQINHY